MTRTRHLTPILVALLSTAAAGQEEESRSAELAARLVTMLDERALEAVATPDPAQEGRFAAALYLPGSQLLAITAQHPDPDRLRRAVKAGHHRQVYIALHTESAKSGRLFVEDLQANGLRPTRENNEPFDIVWENGVTQTVYDGDWQRQYLTRAVYQQRFEEADRRYAELLQLLIDALESPPAPTEPSCCSD